jgi:hypothetical protein
MPMSLTSSAFAAGKAIPQRYTCEGQDISPPLTWSGAPAGTRSFVLLCDDPDAPAGTWHHWALFDIPASTSDLAESYARDAHVGATRQAINDFGASGYGGPCPPKGHGTHHYHFKLLALDVEKLDVKERSRCKEVEAAARGHVLATAELIGTYARR